MTTLTLIQQHWWLRLDQLIKENNVKTQYELQTVIRQLAIEVIAAQPNLNCIQLGTQVLQRFPSRKFASKAAFIKHHQKDGVWGEDSLLFPLLDALGYQAFMHLSDTGIRPYSPYEPTSQTKLQIDVVNYGAKTGGNHWELKGERTPGDGNCMYHTVAQQVNKDIALVRTRYLPTLTANNLTILPATSTRKHHSFLKKQPKLTPEEKAQFERIEQIDKLREQITTTILTQQTTAQLIAIYNDAIKNLVENDTYLINRPENAEQETGSDFMRQALTTGQWDKDIEFLLRDELIHALAKEAWRNPKAYAEFSKLSDKSQVTQVSCAQEAKEEGTIEPNRTTRLTGL